MLGIGSWWKSRRRVAWGGSNQVMKGTFWFLLTIHDGKVVRLEIYGERDQVLEAAWLRE